MSKDLLKQLKDSALNIGEAEPLNPTDKKEASAPVEPVESPKPPKEKPVPAKNKLSTKNRVGVQEESGQVIAGFEELYEILKEEKNDFNFGKRIVYIDEDMADILDLLRKEAKINSNLLTSYLLKKFFIQNIGLIKVLKEKKKSNKFLD